MLTSRYMSYAYLPSSLSAALVNEKDRIYEDTVLVCERITFIGESDTTLHYVTLVQNVSVYNCLAVDYTHLRNIMP